MSFLLDTNVVSETTKRPPNADVLRWFAATSVDDVFLSIAVVAEIAAGIAKTPVNRHGVHLQAWLDHELLPTFAGRILPLDEPVATTWGRFTHILRTAGVRDVAMDAAIAATAAVHGLTVVTRNIRHFAPLGVPTFDPYEGQPTADLDA